MIGRPPLVLTVFQICHAGPLPGLVQPISRVPVAGVKGGQGLETGAGDIPLSRGQCCLAGGVQEGGAIRPHASGQESCDQQGEEQYERWWQE